MMLHHTLWADVTQKGNHCQGNGSSAGRGAQRHMKSVPVIHTACQNAHVIPKRVLVSKPSLWGSSPPVGCQFPVSQWSKAQFPQCLAFLSQAVGGSSTANLPVGLSYSKQFYSKIIAGFGLNFQGEKNKARYKQKQHLAALLKRWKAKSVFKSQTEISTGPL